MNGTNTRNEVVAEPSRALEVGEDSDEETQERMEEVFARVMPHQVPEDPDEETQDLIDEFFVRVMPDRVHGKTDKVDAETSEEPEDPGNEEHLDTEETLHQRGSSFQAPFDFFNSENEETSDNEVETRASIRQPNPSLDLSEFFHSDDSSSEEDD
jgi:hypothetical protein